MNTISKKQIAVSWTLFLLAILLFTIHSCKSTDDTISSGPAVVNVILADVETVQDDDLTFGDKKSASTNKLDGNALAELQTIKDTTIALSSGYSIGVKLVDQTNSNATQTNKLASTNGAVAASETIRTPLANGIRYKLVVYNADGTYKTQKDYVYGPAKATDTIAGLDAGKPYIFVAYSINSATALPSIGTGNLSSAKLSNISGDLMTFKKTVTLNYGQNDLSVILKHRFSQITTTLNMDTRMTGAITQLSGLTFGTTYTSADVSFSSNDIPITYNGTANKTTPVQLPALGSGSRIVTSTSPTLLINPDATDKKLTFGSITIDGETQVNKFISGIKVRPGHRYNLILTFNACSEPTETKSFGWSYAACSNQGAGPKSGGGCTYKYGEVITNTFTSPSADYGFELNITRLDNSFNMEVNGKQLATGEIQFEINNDLKQNVEFIDGTQYGYKPTYPQGNIWDDPEGTIDNPVIRILISRTGGVTMFGRKTATGQLEQLRFKASSGIKFNEPFSWSGTGTNTVKVTQMVIGQTIMKGFGSGKKKVKCN